MSRHAVRRLGVLLLFVVSSAATLANVPPTMEEQYVTTVQDTPVGFELRAKDEDIDPSDPAAHPLRFVLLGGPSHGAVIGDLTKVRIEGPHDAVVELGYVPAAGFVGTDLVTIAVYDPYDESATATVTIRIDVAARRAEGILSGNWSMDVTWALQSGSVTAWRTQLTEIYRVGALALKGVAQVRTALVGGVEEVVFDALRFEGDVRLGTLTATSTLAFDPDAPEPFDYWRTAVGFALQGVSFRHTFYLTQPVTSSYQTLHARASVGAVSITNTLRLDVDEECAFGFGGDDAQAAWSWCGLELAASLSVTCAGFEKATFKLSRLPVSALVPGMTLDAELGFAGDANTLNAALVWRLATIGCIGLYGELDVGGTGSWKVEGFSLYAVCVECEVGGAEFVSATSLDPSKNALVTGQADYFEALRLSGTLAGLCDVPGTWGLAAYFSAGSTELFDWGMLTAAFDMALGEQLNVSVELVCRSGELGDPRVELSFGLVVRW